jgi:hypothetical protein
MSFKLLILYVLNSNFSKINNKSIIIGLISLPILGFSIKKIFDNLKKENERIDGIVEEAMEINRNYLNNLEKNRKKKEDEKKPEETIKPEKNSPKKKNTTGNNKITEFSPTFNSNINDNRIEENISRNRESSTTFNTSNNYYRREENREKNPEVIEFIPTSNITSNEEENKPVKPEEIYVEIKQ